MNSEEIILNSDLDESTFPGMQISKFQNLAKEFFQFDVFDDQDTVKKIKEAARNYSFNLPQEFREIFIRYEDAPIYWILRSPLMEQLENIYKSLTYNSAGQNIYKSAREFYTKWIIIKSQNEKKYFAASFLNAVEKKSNKNNFIFQVMQAVILSYEKQLFNPSIAIELLERSKEILNDVRLDETNRDEISYLINLYSGFVYLNQKDLPQAKIKFSQAIPLKSNGITAKFYNALVDVQLSQSIISAEVLSDLYNYDLGRLEFAIESNDVTMIDYFLKTSAMRNLFYYPEFAASYEVILNFLNSAKNSSDIDLKMIHGKINTFKNLDINEYYTENVIKDLAFFDKVIENFRDNANVIFIGAMSKFQEKFNRTAQEITKVIRNKYFAQIKEKLNIYDKEIQDKLNDIQMLTRNFEEQKQKLREKLDHSLKIIENRAHENIALLEERIKNLQFVQSLNPALTFKNAMTYNFILSVTVFLMGGCAGYSNSFMSNINKTNNLLSIVLITGLKWGIIAFTVGLVISIISAGLAVLESSNQRQRLQQAIKSLKDEKEYQVDYFKKEFERNNKESEEKFNKTIEDKKKRINEVKTERDKQEKIYNEDAEQKIREESKKLMELIEL